jgi:hypothetical protein
MVGMSISSGVAIAFQWKKEGISRVFVCFYDFTLFLLQNQVYRVFSSLNSSHICLPLLLTKSPDS